GPAGRAHRRPQGGRRRRTRRAVRPGHLRGADGAGARLHRRGPGRGADRRGRDAPHRRRSRPGLLRRPDRLPRRGARCPHRPGGNLRSGGGGHAVLRPRPRHRTGQLHPLRVGRRGLHPRHRQGDGPRPAGQGGYGLGEHLCPTLPEQRNGRRAPERSRSPVRPRGPPRIHRAEEHRDRYRSPANARRLIGSGRGDHMSLVSPRAAASVVWDQSCFLPRKDIEARQLARLQQLLAYCYEHVPLYRRLYDAGGFKPADVRTLDDFKRKVPRLDKPDLMADQAASGVALRNDLPVGAAAYYHQTSGTTGAPLEEWSTTYDMMTVADSWIATWWAAGMRPSDLVYFCFNFGTFAGFWTAYYAAQRMSCTIASGAGLATKQRLAQIAKLRPAALVATPTYLLRMIEEAAEI